MCVQIHVRGYHPPYAFSLITIHILQVLGTPRLMPLAKNKEFFQSFTAFITTTIAPIEEKYWGKKWGKFTFFQGVPSIFDSLPQSAYFCLIFRVCK